MHDDVEMRHSFRYPMVVGDGFRVGRVFLVRLVI